MASAGTHRVAPTSQKQSCGHLKDARVSDDNPLPNRAWRSTCLRSYQGKIQLAKERVQVGDRNLLRRRKLMQI